MPQTYTYSLNKTITAILENSGAPQFDSLSVRITGLGLGVRGKLFGVTWNLTGVDDGALNDALYTRLMVVRNEVFDPTFQYNNPVVDQQKEIIFRDVIVPSRGNPAINSRIAPLSRHLNFVPGIPLRGPCDYLVIVTSPIRLAGSAPYRVTMTARGQIGRDHASSKYLLS